MEAGDEAFPVHDQAAHLATAHEQAFCVFGAYREAQLSFVHVDEFRVGGDPSTHPGRPEVFEFYPGADGGLVFLQVPGQGGDRRLFGEREQTRGGERRDVAAAHRRRGVRVGDDDLGG